MKINREVSTAALTRVEVLIAIVTCLAVSTVILSTRCHDSTKRNWIWCVNNLKQLGISYRTWAEDYDGLLPMQVSGTHGGSMEAAFAGNPVPTYEVISNLLLTPKLLWCPTDKRRVAATNFALHAGSVSYFVGLDVNLTNAHSLLGGDRNLTNANGFKSGLLELTVKTPSGWTRELHQAKGNLLLSDGSVQLVSEGSLLVSLRDTGFETNRIVIP